MEQESKKNKERFVKALEKYDFKDEAHLLQAARWVIYVILMFMEVLVLLQHIEQFIENQDILSFVAFLIVACTLTITEAMKNFDLNDEPNERLNQMLEGLCACGFVAFTVGPYSLIIYLLILTQFYLDFKDEKFGVWTLARILLRTSRLGYLQELFS